MDDVVAKLEAEYCPPLDPALLSAILSDFDLSVEINVREARATLNPLKESALLEEEAGFDASGTGAQDGGLLVRTGAESCPDTSASVSRETDMTSLSNEMSSLDLERRIEEEVTPPGNIEELENLDEDTKIQLLLDVFQNRTSRYNVQHTLRKCNGRWHAAMEELLNHVYLAEAEHSGDGTQFFAKGVEAFSQENIARKSRKDKARKKAMRPVDHRRTSSLPGSPAESSSPQTNKWQTSSQDIEFITDRTKLPVKLVTSAYYNSGASLSSTLATILKDNVCNDEPSDDPILAVNAHDLGVEFPSIAPAYVQAIVRLTHPSTGAAHELAKALTAKQRSPEGGIAIIPNYARPITDGLDSDRRIVARRPQSYIASVEVGADAPGATERASLYATARSTALSQAYAAHRKAKSNHLMGGAAAYYSQVGRDLGAMSFEASAAAADELADSQSSPFQVDLHGIDVLNAVRIAHEKVEQWWEKLGEHRFDGRVGAGDRQSGYTIVVGLGRHSEGGKGKLGPAVSKMLRNDGWKIEPAGAVIVVKGRARK